MLQRVWAGGWSLALKGKQTGLCLFQLARDCEIELRAQIEQFQCQLRPLIKLVEKVGGRKVGSEVKEGGRGRGRG